jgi:hypothetical protein
MAGLRNAAREDVVYMPTELKKRWHRGAATYGPTIIKAIAAVPGIDAA